jgi:hypothetical protein
LTVNLVEGIFLDGENMAGADLKILKRCFWIGLGYGAAVLAATAIAMIVAPLLAGNPLEAEGTFLLILVAAPVIGLKALAMAAVAILIAEFTSLRTSLYFGLAGLIIGHVIAGDFNLAFFARDGAVEPSYLTVILAGLIGGIVYWRVTAQTAAIAR